MPKDLTLTDDATEADLPQIADVQTASWQRTYRGMLPDRFLDEELPCVLSRRWSAWPGEAWHLLVVRGEDGLDGFASLDMAHDGGPYVDNLHVRAAAQGRGLGRALMAAAAARVLDAGGDRLWLTVMRENAGTRAFYARIGGQEGEEMPDAVHGQPCISIPVRWTGTPALRDLAGR